TRSLPPFQAPCLPAKWKRGRRDCPAAVAPARAERDARNARSARSNRRWQPLAAFLEPLARPLLRPSATSPPRAEPPPHSIPTWAEPDRSARREDSLPQRAAPYSECRPAAPQQQSPAAFPWDA